MFNRKGSVMKKLLFALSLTFITSIHGMWTEAYKRARENDGPLRSKIQNVIARRGDFCEAWQCFNPYYEGESAVHAAAICKDSDLLQFVLDQGGKANPQIPFRLNGVSPLYLAVFWERYENVKLLVDRGADVNIGEIAGPLDFEIETPLKLAIKRGYRTIATLLVSHGAQVEASWQAELDSLLSSDQERIATTEHGDAGLPKASWVQRICVVQ